MATSAAANLEDVASVDLMTELLRRMKCSTKPDKRLILVGKLLCFSLKFSMSISSILFSPKFSRHLYMSIVHFLRSDAILSRRSFFVNALLS